MESKKINIRERKEINNTYEIKNQKPQDEISPEINKLYKKYSFFSSTQQNTISMMPNDTTISPSDLHKKPLVSS